jgi:hypothetical protein
MLERVGNRRYNTKVVNNFSQMYHSTYPLSPEWLRESHYSRELFLRGNLKRGGYSLKQDFPDMMVNYGHFHAVFYTGDTGRLFPTDENLWLIPTYHIIYAMSEIALINFQNFQRRHGYQFKVQELTLRLMWYDSTDGEDIRDMPHVDSNLASVPIFDTHAVVGSPYWGSVAQHLGVTKPALTHTFRACPEARTYVVAFLQTDPNLISRINGATVGEIVRKELLNNSGYRTGYGV